MKKIKVIVMIVVVILLSFALWRQFASITTDLKNYMQTLSQTTLYLDGRAIQNNALVLRKNEATFVDIILVEPYLPKGYQISNNGERVFFSSSNIAINELELSSAWAFSQPEILVNLPLYSFGDRRYIDIEHLPFYCGITAIDAHGVLQFYTKKADFYYGYVDDDSRLKLTKDAFSPTIKSFDLKEKVVVLEVLDRTLKVLTTEGYLGYVKKTCVRQLYPLEVVPFISQPSSKINKYNRLQMTYDYLESYSEVILAVPSEKITGLDVLIPTCLHLSEGGIVINDIDTHYIKRSQSLGYAVHVRFDNQYNPELTSQLLRDSKNIDRVVSQLIYYALYYGFDGINIDFENVTYEDKANFTSFIKVLFERMKSLELTLSLNIMHPNEEGSESKFLDRGALANYLDYMILMAYDQNIVASDGAGSVASLPWTEESIVMSLVEIPKHKLILGIPTYMRIWQETGVGAEKTVTSSALPMVNLEEFLSKYNVYQTKDDLTGQTYYEMRPNDKTTLKIWAEDLDSVKKRIALVADYDLAGVASWRKGFELKWFWESVESGLKNN